MISARDYDGGRDQWLADFAKAFRTELRAAMTEYGYRPGARREALALIESADWNRVSTSTLELIAGALKAELDGRTTR